MEDIAVQGHFPHIGPGVANARFGHAPLYLGQLVRRDHHMKVPVPLAPGRQRSSRSRLRLWAGGSFTLSSSFFSGPLGSGEGGRLFKMPSSILSFCSSESSAVCRWLSLSFIASSLSVLMGLVVFDLVGLLGGLRSACGLLELGRDGGPGRPVRIAGSRAQFVVLHLPVSLRLRQKHHKVGVFKDVFNLPAGKEVFHILRQGARDAALFTEHFPDGDEVAGSQLVLQQHMELVIVAPCSDTTGEVVGNLTVHQIVDDVHGNRAEARPQLLQVEAHHTGVSVIHIGLVVEDVEGARHIC